jgi:hypothetical protein
MPPTQELVPGQVREESAQGVVVIDQAVVKLAKGRSGDCPDPVGIDYIVESSMVQNHRDCEACGSVRIEFRQVQGPGQEDEFLHTFRVSAGEQGGHEAPIARTHEKQGSFPDKWDSMASIRVSRGPV